MEFLKTHYEKLILSLVLLLMAGGAVMLVLEAGSVEEQLKGFRDIIVTAGGQPPAPPDPAPYRTAISNATRPAMLDLGRSHRVFNPDLWLVDTNGNLISGRDVGPHKLTVTRIEPLHLRLELGAAVTPERTNYTFRGVREYEATPSLQRLANTTIALNATNVLDRTRKINAVVREIKNPGENPEVTFDLSMGGVDLKTGATISKATPFAIVIEYVAALEYKPENQKWPADRVPPLPPIPQNLARRDTKLYFAGDTNIIVEITATNVIVKAVSNDKPTTIPLGLPAAPARKGP